MTDPAYHPRLFPWVRRVFAHTYKTWPHTVDRRTTPSPHPPVPSLPALSRAMPPLPYRGVRPEPEGAPLPL